MVDSHKWTRFPDRRGLVSETRLFDHLPAGMHRTVAECAEHEMIRIPLKASTRLVKPGTQLNSVGIDAGGPTLHGKEIPEKTGICYLRTGLRFVDSATLFPIEAARQRWNCTLPPIALTVTDSRTLCSPWGSSGMAMRATSFLADRRWSRFPGFRSGERSRKRCQTKGLLDSQRTPLKRT